MQPADQPKAQAGASTSYYLSQSVATLLIPGTGQTVAEWIDSGNGPLVLADRDPVFREWLGKLREAALDMLVTDPYDPWPISGSVVITQSVYDANGHEVMPPVALNARNCIAVVQTRPGSTLPTNPARHSPAPGPPSRPVAQPPVAESNDQLRYSLWNSALRRLNGIREEFVAYETDPTAFFHRPLLSDRSHPAVQAFYEAFAQAEALHIDDAAPNDLEFVKEFADRSAAAETAWRAAYEAASASGDSHLSVEQQRLLRRAESTIRVALDDRTPPNERAAAYLRVIDIFGKAHLNAPRGIAIDLRKELENATRMALPAHSRSKGHSR